MTAQFTDIAENVFNRIDDILDLLPFRAVARDIKIYADRRICQIILHAVSRKSDVDSEFCEMGLIRVQAYDGPLAMLNDRHDRHPINYLIGPYEYEDGVVTYGGYDAPLRGYSEEICLASQVIAEGGQGCKIRFRPQSPPVLLMTSRTHLQIYCTQHSGRSYDATMLDDVVIEPDAHQGEEIREVLSELGSSFAIQRRIAEADNDTAADLLTFTELPFSQNSWLELIYIDTPLSLLLRGFPDWKVSRGHGSDLWDGDYDDDYYGGRSDEESYDIDNDSDFWRRAMD
jgi:hypothetical protein